MHILGYDKNCLGHCGNMCLELVEFKLLSVFLCSVFLNSVSCICGCFEIFEIFVTGKILKGCTLPILLTCCSGLLPSCLSRISRF